VDINDGPNVLLGSDACISVSFCNLLSLKVLIGVISFKAFEMWWLILSFTWGIINLWGRTNLDDQGQYKWTFGQVMALLVLAAPIIASAEGYITGMKLNPVLHLLRTQG
jgi:hypothetical protein